MTLKRVVAALAIAVGILAVLIAGTVWYAVSSQTAARRLIAFALGKSAIGLEIGEVRGPLGGPLVLLGVRYRSGGLSAEADSVWLTWRPSQLLKSRVQLDSVYASGVRVILPDSAPPDTLGTARGRRENPATPLPVILGSVQVRDLQVDAPQKTTLRGGSLDLAGRLDDYHFTMLGDGYTPSVGALRVRLTGRGDLERVTLDHSIADVLDGRVVGSGAVGWWPDVTWNLTLAGFDLRVGSLLENPASLPGRLTLYGSSSGMIDSSGPVGRLIADSLAGQLRGHAVRGRGEVQFRRTNYELTNVDVDWGAARIRAEGWVSDTIAVAYDIAVGTLAMFQPKATGTVTANGTARGPRLTPVLRATVGGRRVGYGDSYVSRLSGRVDIDLARNGRTIADLKADSGVIVGRELDHAVIALRGTQLAHRVSVDAVAPADSAHLDLTGRLDRARWNGTIDTLDVYTGTVGPWQIADPVAVAASRTSARLDSLCLTAASGPGQVCAAGDWTGGDNWNVLASATEIPVTRLPARFEALPGGETALAGTLGARFEAHSAAGRVDATLRVISDTIAFTYREDHDTLTRRLALDSAVVDVRADANGLVATVGARVVDDTKREVAVLTGRATAPQYRWGQSPQSTPLTARLQGHSDDLGFALPLVAGLDSLTGAADLDVSATGTMGAPHIVGSIKAGQVVATVARRSRVTGSAELKGDVVIGADRSISGDLELKPTGVRYEYLRFGNRRIMVVDSGGVVVNAGPNGVRGSLGLRFAGPDSVRVASITAQLTLPQYTRLSQPFAAQPLQLRASAQAPDLAVFQPIVMSVDTLGGSLTLDLEGRGTVGVPSLTGKLTVDSANGRLPSGTVIHGGLRGDLSLQIALADSSIHGNLHLEPDDLTFRYTEGAATALVRLDSTALDLQAGPDGVRGSLDAVFADSAGATLATLRGQAALPGYTRVTQRLWAQPLEGKLEGRAENLAFIEAFTGQVDSAAGRLTLDATLGGTMGDSRLSGDLEIKDGAAHLPIVGILLHDLQLTAKGAPDGVISIDGRVRSGGGDLTISGSTSPDPSASSPGRIKVKGTNFEMANNARLHALVTPDLDITLAGDVIGVRGEAALPLARIALSEIPEFAISPSDDVVLLDSLQGRTRKRAIDADVRLTLGDSVSFEGFHFKAELGGSLAIRQPAYGLATATGTLEIEEGHYKAFGQDLTIEHGIALFAGGPVDNPALSIRASRVGDDSTLAGFQIAGTLKDPDMTLFSDRTMSQSQTLSYILTGRPIDDGSTIGPSLIGRAISSLGLRGGDVLAQAVGRSVGLEDVQLLAKGDLRSVAFVAGRYLSPNLYVSYGIGLFDPVSTLRLRYVLSSHLTLQAEVGKEANADIFIKSDKRR